MALPLALIAATLALALFKFTSPLLVCSTTVPALTIASASVACVTTLVAPFKPTLPTLTLTLLLLSVW